jgi:hypothetical protein
LGGAARLPRGPLTKQVDTLKVADLVPSLSKSILSRLGYSPGESDGVRSWFERGTYRVDNYDPIGGLNLNDIRSEQLSTFIAYDYERFALSSWESQSMAALESSTHNLPSWPLLKLYYSAFFAAHAIMRLLGGGIIKIEGPQVSALNTLLGSLGGAGIGPGMYFYEVTSDPSGRVNLVLKPHAEGGGVHEGFWKSFATFLEKLATDATANGDPDANAFLAGLSEIVPALRPGYGKRSVWFSAMRNEINYQHKFNVWFPTINVRNFNKEIVRTKAVASQSIRLDVSRSEFPIIGFIQIASYLATLNSELAEYVASRSLASRCFGAKWRRIRKTCA